MEARSALLLVLLILFSLFLTPTGEGFSAVNQSAETTLGTNGWTPDKTTLGTTLGPNGWTSDKTTLGPNLGPRGGTPDQTTLEPKGWTPAKTTLEPTVEPFSATSAKSTLEPTGESPAKSTPEPVPEATRDIKVNAVTFKGNPERNVIAPSPFPTDSSSAATGAPSTPSPVVSVVPFTGVLTAALASTQGPTTSVPTTPLTSEPPSSSEGPTASNAPTGPSSGPWKDSPGHAVSGRAPPEERGEVSTPAPRTTSTTATTLPPTSRSSTPIPTSGKRSGGVNLLVPLAVVVLIAVLLVILVVLWQRRRQRRRGAMTFAMGGGGGGKRNGVAEAWAGPAQVPEDGAAGNVAPKETEEPGGGGPHEGQGPTRRSTLTTFFGKRKSAQGSALMGDVEACDGPSGPQEEAIPLVSYKEVTAEGENGGSPAGEPEPPPAPGADE
ncbi:leukosialin [Tachyglossus aculeatus]|uniref:leukosialin n=1 Tax=Tachyglossus aculeatus TaxID=9261 RepID=UPI0018F5E67E|nr:leukosialin [Tachyglossus aculeatus]